MQNAHPVIGWNCNGVEFWGIIIIFCYCLLLLFSKMAAVTCDNRWRAADWVHLSVLSVVWEPGQCNDFCDHSVTGWEGSSCRRLALERLAFDSVPWPGCFFPMHPLPLRQVSFCRDSLSPAGGDTQGADSPRSCGDSGFVSSGCLALSSYPLRVGSAVTATPGAAGWEAVGRAKGGGWRTGTEPLILLFSFPLLTGRHRNYKTENTHTSQIHSRHKAQRTLQTHQYEHRHINAPPNLT